MLTEFILKYPVLAEILMWIGIFRIVFKPAVYYYGQYVKSTPTKIDDKKYFGVINSPLYIILCFLLDLTVSIKLPKKG